MCNGNTILYECLHCKDQRGKSNTRKKIEWPRKDNFLAHLDRIHHIRHRPSDNLDQYIIRIQHHPQDLTDNTVGTRGQAQHLALQGIGTGAHADLNGPHSRTAFANELAADDQANDVFQEQRFSMFIHRNSRVLANAIVLEPSTQQEFISPDMLDSHENNFDVMGASSYNADNDGLQQPGADPSGDMPLVPNDHHTDSDASHDNYGLVTNQSHDDGSDSDENDEYASDKAQGTSPTSNTATVASQNRPELTTASLYANTSQDATFTLSGMMQRSSRLTASEDILGLLRQIPRETLQAALDSRAPESDEGDVAETYPASKSSIFCPTCQKVFKRQCELT